MKVCPTSRCSSRWAGRRENAEDFEQSGCYRIGFCFRLLLKGDTPPGQFGPWKLRGEQMDTDTQTHFLCNCSLHDDVVIPVRSSREKKETKEHGIDCIWTGYGDYCISVELQQDQIWILHITGARSA
jgi:hypothetical protein